MSRFQQGKYTNSHFGETTDSSSVRLFRGRRAMTVFPTRSTPGAKIRDAVTGAFTPYRVGSNLEGTFFKVTLATGECGYEGNLLFFQGPEEYERFFQTTMDWNAKQEWYNRQPKEPVVVVPNSPRSPPPDYEAETVFEYDEDIRCFKMVSV